MLTLADVCEADARPGWVGYIRVDDADAAVDRLKAAGGQLRRGPEDIPHVGRFAVVGDPQGAGFNLLAPDGPDMPPAPPKTPGHVGWHELYAADGAAIFDFYAGQFGWSKGEPFDMGDLGIYQLFAAGGEDIGGIMTKPPFIPAPVWLFYFTVAGGAEAAAARVTAHGGKIINGPMEVPSGDWIVQCLDPEGVMFALVSDGK
jgi:predicted enzyme related to lactoylglutathione lyase